MLAFHVTAALVVTTFALATAGCGTRVHDAERSSAPGSTAAPGLAAPAQASAAPPVGSTARLSPPGSPASAMSSPTTLTVGDQGRSLRPVTTGPAPAAAKGPGRAGEAGAPPAGDGRPTATATPSPVPSAREAANSPVVVGSVGTYSGPVGTLFVPMVQGVQAWVAWMNGRGGLHGHPLRLIVADDGGDGARSRALVQEIVERQGAIAFVQMSQGLSGPGSVEYLTEKRVPVVGGETGSPWFYGTSPMFFPQVSSGVGIARALLYAAAQRLLPLGKRKLGTIVCVEAQVCREGDAAWSGEAASVGFDLTYRGTASLGQPDFTAQCLAARNQGAEVFLLGLDTNSVGRVAASCARQGYRPTFGILGGTLAHDMQEDQNLTGSVSATPAFPYFETGTPAADEYHAVMRSYGKGIALGEGPATGWVSAKLLEKAAADLGEPPSSQAILQGLWRIRNDDLGGITEPLGFTQDRPVSLVVCWWNLQITDKTWVSPDGFQRHCR